MSSAELRRVRRADRKEWLRLRRDAAHDVMIDLAPTVICALRHEDEMSLDDMLFTNEGTDEVEHGCHVLALFEEDEDKADQWLYRLLYRTDRVIREPTVADRIERVAAALLATPTMTLADLLRLLGVPSRRQIHVRWGVP